MHDPSAGNDVFAAIERLDTRLTVFDWPERPDPALEAAVAHLAAFEQGNGKPTLLRAEGRCHLAWHGRLTGGLGTLYERLAPFLRLDGLDAHFADSRLEVFAPARGPLVLLGAERRAEILGRGEFERRLALVDAGRPVAATFPLPEGAGDAPAGDSRPALPALDRAPATPPPFAEGLRDADATLTERYDPDGFLEEAWVSCQTLEWRTDFMAPGTARIPGEAFAETLVWRTARWEWLAERGGDHDVGRWALRSHGSLTASDVAALLPPALGWWVRRATEEGVRLCEALRDGGEEHCDDAELRLRTELAQLPA